MPFTALIAMQAPGKIGMVIVILVFCLVPLTVIGEDPGFGVAALTQVSALLLTLAALLWLSWSKPLPTITWRLVVGYLVVNSISNLCALFLIPHLLH
jgi:hypothetical protein